MAFYPNERLALFIDGANLYSAARSLQFDIDYKRLLELFRTRGNLVRAYYYTVLIEDQEYSPIRPLVDWLDYNGYSLITKPARDYTDSTGRRRIRASIDADLAVDMLELAPRLDHVVLFSGDGGYRRLIEAVQRQGCRVSVVSTIRSQPPLAADEVRRQADNFIDLTELREQIERARGDRPARPPVTRPAAEAGYDDEDDDEYYEDDEDDDEEFEDDEEEEEEGATPEPAPARPARGRRT
ncbi:MAG: NYN domain-containing protein [Alphaproteobacteria bacterium]|nr:NYN domain-containing protein [Alphaproteobacteria bacterium]